MMLAALATLTLLSGAAAGTADDACDDVLDRTAQCTAPHDTPTTVREDAKTARVVPAAPLIDPTTVAPQLGIAAVLLGGLGGMGIAMAETARPQTEAQRTGRDVAFGVGVGLVSWGGLTGAAAIALAVFDPSTGAFRLPPLEEP